MPGGSHRPARRALLRADAGERQRVCERRGQPDRERPELAVARRHGVEAHLVDDVHAYLWNASEIYQRLLNEHEIDSIRGFDPGQHVIERRLAAPTD